MKLHTKITAILAMGLLLNSCSGNDDNETITGTGTLGIEFDNAFGGNDLILNAANTATSNNEILKISQVKYIVSNIVLTAEDGTTFTYPKNESYFIVDESDENSLVLDLDDVPAANYTKVKFGIGVDEAQYNLGQAAQADFAAQAATAGLLPSWNDGYGFLSFDGTFTASNYPEATPYHILTGKTAANYNYKEITLNLPTKALVRTNIAPEIHIIADVSKLIDGTNKISLAGNVTGNIANITGAANVGLVTQNLDGVFTVAHVHND
ncbi:MbnP family protein [Flavobacterium sp. 3HN19-14]|uniref:MbnP family protein n=1 Tax=Flavobacterium sp. 3HN19-14 TaxID=3448133 RepID=UPI003EE1D18E